MFGDDAVDPDPTGCLCEHHVKARIHRFLARAAERDGDQVAASELRHLVDLDNWAADRHHWIRSVAA